MRPSHASPTMGWNVDGEANDLGEGENINPDETVGAGQDPEPDLPPKERFAAAKEVFDDLMEQEFPEFTVEGYAKEKAAQEDLDQEGLAAEDLPAKLWENARSVPKKLDLTGDGKVGIADGRLAIGAAAAKAGDAWEKVTELGEVEIGEAVSALGNKTAQAGKGFARSIKRGATRARGSFDRARDDKFRASRNTVAKIGKTAIGVQGVQNRREAKEIREATEEYKEAAEAFTEARRSELNEQIEKFGDLRLQALRATLGRFLKILKELNQQNRTKEYELLDGLGIDTRTLESMGALDMTVNESLKTTTATGVLALTAVMGTPALVTGTVGALASASTGTAISTLSGAAYTNAVLAWLGGGSLATSGGGMALGATVLAGITAGATAGVALLSAGVLTSAHYSRKLTETKSYQRDIALEVAGLENAWVVMDGISARVDELTEVTDSLQDRTTPLLDELQALAPTFDAADPEDAALFNQCGLLVKTMVELAQVPLLGEDGELTDESMSVTVKVKKVLNTEINHE